MVWCTNFISKWIADACMMYHHVLISTLVPHFLDNQPCDCISLLSLALIHHGMIWCTSIWRATFPSWQSITLSHPPCLYTNYFLPAVTLLGVMMCQQTTHTSLPLLDCYHWCMSFNLLHLPMYLHRSYSWILSITLSYSHTFTLCNNSNLYYWGALILYQIFQLSMCALFPFSYVIVNWVN